MENIKLRPAVLDDLDVLLAFEQGIIDAERPFEPALKPGPIHYYNLEEMIQSKDTELVVALLDDKIIGCGYIRMEKTKSFQKDDHYAYIGFMYVKSQHRGKGVGQEILIALQSWASSRNVNEILLDVYHDNLAAIRTYEKAGFKRHLVKMRLGK